MIYDEASSVVFEYEHPSCWKATANDEDIELDATLTTASVDSKDNTITTLKMLMEHGKSKLVDNEDGKHSIVCTECGEVLTADISHEYEGGKCACSAECKCKNINVVIKDDGSHAIVCADCNKLLDTMDGHEYGEDGKCICGAVKPEDATKPEDTTKPNDTTKPDNTTKPEDTTKPENAIKPADITKPSGAESTKKPASTDNKIPNTGSTTAGIAALALFSISVACAVVVSKKKKES